MLYILLPNFNIFGGNYNRYLLLDCN